MPRKDRNIEDEPKLVASLTVPASEAIQKLQSNIAFAGVGASMRVIGVTSSVQGEGKSTLIANMAAGHIVLFSLIALGAVVEFLFGNAALSLGVVQPAAIVFTVAIEGLELFVAFLQAYVFTLLSALFVGAAVHQGH